jgi:hypothetical protein
MFSIGPKLQRSDETIWNHPLAKSELTKLTVFQNPLDCSAWTSDRQADTVIRTCLDLSQHPSALHGLSVTSFLAKLDPPILRVTHGNLS